MRIRYLAGASAVSALVTVGALRHNYQTMTKLRTAVFDADEQNGDVETALQNLRSYVGSHMNTELNSGDNTVYPPIQLKYRYDRLVAAQKDQTANAQNACNQQVGEGFSSADQAACIQQYIAANGTTSQVAIPDSAYKFDFITPAWSPDLAGWSIVITIVLSLATIGLAIKRRLAKKH